MERWTLLIQERLNIGQSISEFCLERGLSENSYYYWLRMIRSQTVDSAIAALPQKTRENRFVELVPGTVSSPVNNWNRNSRFPPDPVPSAVLEKSGLHIELFSDTPADQIRILMEAVRHV